MTLEGVVSILEGMNPRMLETKLLGFLADAQKTAMSSRLKRSLHEPAPPTRYACQS